MFALNFIKPGLFRVATQPRISRNFLSEAGKLINRYTKIVVSYRYSYELTKCYFLALCLSNYGLTASNSTVPLQFSVVVADMSFTLLFSLLVARGCNNLPIFVRSS